MPRVVCARQQRGAVVALCCGGVAGIPYAQLCPSRPSFMAGWVRRGNQGACACHRRVCTLTTHKVVWPGGGRRGRGKLGFTSRCRDATVMRWGVGGEPEWYKAVGWGERRLCLRCCPATAMARCCQARLGYQNAMWFFFGSARGVHIAGRAGSCAVCTPGVEGAGRPFPQA